MNSMNGYEMSTPINSLKNNNMSNLVKNVENNIESLKNTNIPSSQPMQVNNDPFTYNPNIISDPKPIVPQQIPQNRPQMNPQQQFAYQGYVKPNNPIRKVIDEDIEEPGLFKKIAVNAKEYLIVILLFSLLAHKKVNRLFFNNVPGLNTINTPIPSLILRGSVMALILFAIKKFI